MGSRTIIKLGRRTAVAVFVHVLFKQFNNVYDPVLFVTGM